MELVWASQDYVISGKVYRGFPILLWDSMESCQPVNQFLRYYLLRGAVASIKSWESTGRALYDFFGYLQAHNQSWTDTTPDKNHIAAYRDYCLTVHELSPVTVRQRLLYITKFYEFSLKRGYIKNLPFDFEIRKKFLQNRVTSSGRSHQTTYLVSNMMPRVFRSLPKYLTLEEVRKLIKASNNPHHRMIIRFALFTGLRRQEIATFPLSYVSDAYEKGGVSQNVLIRLDPHDGAGIKTKGSKPRDIYITRAFLNELQRYAVQTRGERSSITPNPFKNLFLNGLGKPFAADGKRIERIVREIGNRANIRVYPHLLRHTYATHTLLKLQRHRGDIDPLVFLQRQLGHSSIESTMVYLHLINEVADEAVLAFQDELDSDWSSV